MTPSDIETPDADLPEGDAPDVDLKEEKRKLSLEVKVDQPSACQRHVVVTVSREDIDRYFQDAIDELQPKAEVPGFRPGRAPRKLVEHRFRQEVSEQVKGSVLMDSMAQVSDEHEFSAISEPDFDFDSIEMPDDGPMTFEFDVEVRPEFDLPEWRGMQLERPLCEFSEEDVDARLRDLRSRYAHLTPHDGPVAADDRVTLNLAFRLGDRVLSELEEQTVPVWRTLSFRDGKLNGFDQLMIGAGAGEKKQAKITLSSDLADEQLRGKEVDVELEVLDVKRLDLPALDAGFLERIGGFEDEAELRKAIRGELDRQLRYHQQQRVRQQITSLLTESANWELPPDLLRRQASRELERAVLELRSSGFSEEVIRAHENELQQNNLAATRTALKEHFILERIAEEEKLEVHDDDFDEEIELIAMQSNQSPRRVRARLEKRGQMDTLRNQIIERKAMNLITANAQFKDVRFQLPLNDTVALNHAISGRRKELPEAKHGGEAEELREPADHT